MTFSVRQALIDSGHFTESGARNLVYEGPVHLDFVEGMYVARTIITFDMFGDVVDVKSWLVDITNRKVVEQNRKALGLPPQEDS